MRSRARLAVVGALAAALLIGAVPVASTHEGDPTATKRARIATRYLVHRQHDDGSVPGFSPVGSTADAVVAWVAARRAPKAITAAIRYLRSQVDGITSVGQKAKVVMAVVAAGRDPRDFGGHDLVQEIQTSQQPTGQYGDGSDGTAVTTHALAMLALDAAGVPPSGQAVTWLVDAQCPDGGWQYDRPYQAAVENEHCVAPGGADFASSDANTTSYAVQALESAPVPLGPEHNPFAYFRSARDEIKRGWRYSHRKFLFGARSYTDANSTALVIQAYVAAGKRVPRGGVHALEHLQYSLCGSLRGAVAYSWEKRSGNLRRNPSRRAAAREPSTDPEGVTVAGATIGAIPGLRKRALPVPAAEVTKPAPKPRSC